MSSIGTATSTSKAELTNLPLKLHALLDEAERLGQSSIVSWESDGTAFKVHDKKRFVEEIMPKYFSTSNYQSFQRNCNLWGFRTASKGPNKGQCSHASFVWGDLDACRTMKVIRYKTFPETPSSSSLGPVMGLGPPGAGPSATGTQYSNGTFLCSADSSDNFSNNSMGDLMGGMDSQALLQQLLSQSVARTNNSKINSSGASVLSSLTSALLGGAPENNMAPYDQMIPSQPQQQTKDALQALSALLPATNQSPMPFPQQQGQLSQVSALLSLLGGNPGLQQQQDSDPAQIKSTSRRSSTRNSGSDDESSDSNRSSVGVSGDKFDPLIFKAKELREEAIRRGSRILICRARGMPMNHSGNTAFFEVPANASHGEELVCSHPICRQGGIKFLLCKHCDEPVAKRSFRLHHNHENCQAGESPQNKAKKTERPSEVDDDKKPPARKRQKVYVTEPENSATYDPSAPLAALAAAAGARTPQSVGEGFDSFQITSGYSDTSSFSASRDSNNSSTEDDQNEDTAILSTGHKGGADELQQLKEDWCALLEARNAVETADDMSAWLMRVFSISQRCLTSRNHSVSDGDETNDGEQDPDHSQENSAETRKEPSSNLGESDELE